jgi:hypothetical protein
MILIMFLVPKQDNPGLEVLLVDVAVLCANLSESGKAIQIRIVDGDLMMGEGAVDREKVGKINKILTKIYFVIHYY